MIKNQKNSQILLETNYETILIEKGNKKVKTANIRIEDEKKLPFFLYFFRFHNLKGLSFLIYCVFGTILFYGLSSLLCYQLAKIDDWNT